MPGLRRRISVLEVDPVSWRFELTRGPWEQSTDFVRNVRIAVFFVDTVIYPLVICNHMFHKPCK